MIRLTRRMELLATDAFRRFSGLRRPGLRIYTARLSDLTFEMRPVVAGNAPANSYVHYPWGLTAVLEGELILRRGGSEVTLRRGDAWCESINVYDERWQSGLRLLMVEWDERFGAAPTTGHLRLERQRARLMVFAERLESIAPAVELVPDFKALLDGLRAEGLPLAEVGAAALAEVPAGVALVAERLNLAFTGLHRQPMWVDLQQTLSERHLRRLITAHAEWFGLPGNSLRTALNSYRLQAAVTLLSVENAKLEHIARSLGYGSDRALITRSSAQVWAHRQKFARRSLAVAEEEFIKSDMRAPAAPGSGLGGMSLNKKPLITGVLVSLLVLGVFEVLVATVHPSFEPPATTQAALSQFIGSWERYWFKYGINAHGTVWGMRRSLERTYDSAPRFGSSFAERKPTPAELEQDVRSGMRRIKSQLNAVLRWALFAWPVGWLAFFVASLLKRLAEANTRVSDELVSERRYRAARNNSVLSMTILAASGLALVSAVLLPVIMVQGDVPSALMSAPMVAGWITVWRLQRRQLAAQRGAEMKVETVSRAA